MNNCNTTNYSGRSRNRTKQPIYTSDKRAKFTQRENKKWIRFLTVLGYIFFVSMPALSLSFYYIYIWDPGYMSKVRPLHNKNRNIFLNDSIHPYPVKYIDPIKTDRPSREMPDNSEVTNQTPLKSPDINVILREGVKSMESSASQERPHNRLRN